MTAPTVSTARGGDPVTLVLFALVALFAFVPLADH